MGGSAGAPLEHRFLNLLTEQALAANRGQRAILHDVAAGSHEQLFERDVRVLRREPRDEGARLGQGQRALTRRHHDLVAAQGASECARLAGGGVSPAAGSGSLGLCSGPLGSGSSKADISASSAKPGPSESSKSSPRARASWSSDSASELRPLAAWRSFKVGPCSKRLMAASTILFKAERSSGPRWRSLPLRLRFSSSSNPARSRARSATMVGVACSASAQRS